MYDGSIELLLHDQEGAWSLVGYHPGVSRKRSLLVFCQASSGLNAPSTSTRLDCLTWSHPPCGLCCSFVLMLLLLYVAVATLVLVVVATRGFFMCTVGRCCFGVRAAKPANPTSRIHALAVAPNETRRPRRRGRQLVPALTDDDDA